MQPQKRRRWIRSTAAVAVVLLAVLAATPSFLVRSGYLRRILNKKPEKFLLSYASATAPWPWQIVANGLEIRGADPNVEWWFRMERADLKISLFGLLRRRFHVRTLRVEGLRFRLRQRVKREERDAAAVAPLPEIPGFGEVPVKGGAPFFPPPEPPSHYWAVAIDDLVAPASEIWIDQYRYQGPARVTGGFFLWPRKETHIGPASVDFEGGRLSLGENIMASSLRGRVGAKIASYDPKIVRGEEVYRYISGKASVSGPTPDMRWLNYYLRSSPEPRLSGGKGTIEAALSLENGEGFLSAKLDGRRVRAKYQKESLVGDVSLHARLAPWTPAKAEGRFRDTSIELRDVAAGTSKEGWWGKFAVGPGTLRSEDAGLALASAVSIRCRDARPLYTLFQVGLPKWAMGLAKMEGLEAAMHVRLAPALLSVRHLDARGKRFAIVGNYRKKGSVSDGAFLVSSGALSAGVDIDKGKSSIKLVGATKWYAARAATPEFR